MQTVRNNNSGIILWAAVVQGASAVPYRQPFIQTAIVPTGAALVGDIILRSNGMQETLTGNVSDPLNTMFDASSGFIGSLSNFDHPSDFYGMVFLDRDLIINEPVEVEDYLAQLSGVTL
jgi:hypothetical protein